MKKKSNNPPVELSAVDTESPVVSAATDAQASSENSSDETGESNEAAPNAARPSDEEVVMDALTSFFDEDVANGWVSSVTDAVRRRQLVSITLAPDNVTKLLEIHAGATYYGPVNSDTLSGRPLVAVINTVIQEALGGE